MSKSAWCDLNSNVDVLKLQDISPNPRGVLEKQNTFTPRQHMNEGSEIKSKFKKKIEGTQTTWNKSSKLFLNKESPFIDKAVSSETKNSKIGEARSNFLKATSWGTVLSLTDMEVYGLSSEVMWSYFKYYFLLRRIIWKNVANVKLQN